jgi:toxin ParE1/3/4
MTSYRISAKALEDLENIWLCTYTRWSEAQADKYYMQIIDKIELVALDFERGKIRDDIKLGYRSITVQSHTFFYRRDIDGTVEIIRNLHQKMDTERHLR